MTNFNIKSLLIKEITFSFFYSCNNKQQPINYTFIDSLIVGKWQIVEYAGCNVNTLDTFSFYKNKKANSKLATNEFNYNLIKPNSLIVYNLGFEHLHYKTLNYPMTAYINSSKR